MNTQCWGCIPQNEFQKGNTQVSLVATTSAVAICRACTCWDGPGIQPWRDFRSQHHIQHTQIETFESFHLEYNLKHWKEHSGSTMLSNVLHISAWSTRVWGLQNILKPCALECLGALGRSWAGARWNWCGPSMLSESPGSDVAVVQSLEASGTASQHS